MVKTFFNFFLYRKLSDDIANIIVERYHSYVLRDVKRLPQLIVLKICNNNKVRKLWLFGRNNVRQTCRQKIVKIAISKNHLQLGSNS